MKHFKATRNGRHRRSIFTMLLAILLLTAGMFGKAIPAAAAKADISAKRFSFPVRQTADNRNLEDENVTYKLVPLTEGAPMPEGSKNGAYTFAIRGTDTVAVTLNFTNAGVYRYRISILRNEHPETVGIIPQAYTIDIHIRNAAGEAHAAPLLIVHGPNGQKLEIFILHSLLSGPNSRLQTRRISRRARVKIHKQPRKLLCSFLYWLCYLFT